jgi:galactose mutarotase-like enzyme
MGPGRFAPGAADYSVVKRTLRTGLSQGVDVIEVRNGALQFVVVPTRGMGIWKANMGELQLGWRSPVRGPVHPAFVPIAEPGGLGWLRGFDELLVRCGLESNGAPEFEPNGRLRYPLHGRIANLPAHQVEVGIDDDAGEISISGTVDEARLFGPKLQLRSTVTTHFGRAEINISDTVTNLSDEPGDMELLYHINFGVPLLGPGAKVVLPLRKMAPLDAVVAAAEVPTWDVYKPEAAGATESCFCCDLAAAADGQTAALLHNAAGTQGVSVRFNKNQLPCFTVWKNHQGPADGYVTGLEPATNYPNIKSFEKKMGRVPTLAPGESRTFAVTIEALGDAAAVQAARAVVQKLQSGVTPQILPQPDPSWSC